MSGIFYLIDRVAIGIYIIIAAMVVWQMRKFLLAQTNIVRLILSLSVTWHECSRAVH